MAFGQDIKRAVTIPGGDAPGYGENRPSAKNEDSISLQNRNFKESKRGMDNVVPIAYPPLTFRAYDWRQTLFQRAAKKPYLRRRRAPKTAPSPSSARAKQFGSGTAAGDGDAGEPEP